MLARHAHERSLAHESPSRPPSCRLRGRPQRGQDRRAAGQSRHAGRDRLLPSVRRYLKEFLSDRRVIEETRARCGGCVLNLIILTVRPRRKARDYDKIWNASATNRR